MGTIFEELIRKFSEQANETAGEHFTPREVIKLMVKLIVAGNGGLSKPNIIKSIYDPACGTGGMLTIAKNEITHKINPSAKVFLFGQELNPKTYAIAKSDMLIKGENADQIKKGNSFSQDQLENEKFDYMISNPPYGVEWKNVAKQVKAEFENLGFDGRFGAGLPRINDGSFLFLQHMISKMRAISDGGSRIAVIFNGSPLFTGDAGGGESEIRRWVIEHDWLEAIIGLPDQLFYNTGIHTYIWLVTNVKPKNRQGKIQLIDSRKMFKICAQKFGSKRYLIDDGQIENIVSLYKSFENKGKSKIFANDFFGYRKITVEQPKEDDKTKPNPQLRDFERVPLTEDIHEYFEREVKPHVPDAWIDEAKTKIGYEISFTKYFYEYKPLRPLQEIETDIKKLHEETEKIMKEIFND